MEEELVDVDITNIKTDKQVHPHNENTAWRSQGEKYNNKPNDPAYFRDYYRLHAKDQIECERCGKTIFKVSKCKHLRSLKCRLAYAESKNKN